MRFLYFLGLICLFSSCKEATKKSNGTIGKIEVFDPEMLSLMDSLAMIEVLADSFVWSEGPLWLAKENKVIFTDVPTNTIYSWDENNGKKVYLRPSGYTLIADSTGGKEGANGLALDLDGTLILCQHGNRAVARMRASLSTPKDSFTFLATTYKNKRFSSPNDLFITKDGSIFFTDPPYGLPDQDQDDDKQLTYNGIYRLNKNGEVLLLDSTLSKPNGIAFTADEKTMYVANSDPEKAIWMKYSLDDSKNIVSKSLFADKTSDVVSKKGLPDGLKIHSSGIILATGPGGVLVFNSDGKHLGTINTGQATANCALDTEENYLYMTAHQYLMRVKLKK
jgi:gluconolactonase